MATIGINTLFLIPNQVGGTEYHLRSFIDGLQKVDQHNKYILFCNQENFDTFNISNSKWQKVLCPVKATSRIKRTLFEQFRLPQLVSQYECQILHSSGYFGPIYLHNCKHVLTVHDVNWRDHPEDVSFLSRIILQFLIERCLPRAEVIVTDSDFSQQRLLHHFPQFRHKIRVIWPSIANEFGNLKRLPTPRKYVLCVSGLYPHKKIPYLLDLWQGFLEIDKGYQLILVGKNGQDEAMVRSQVQKLRQITYLPKVKFPELLKLYAGASVFIFPSVYEGFGYPVYEACLSGAPTLVGNIKLYHSKIQMYLHELHFDVAKDSQLLQATLRESSKLTAHKLPELTLQYSTKQLLQLYDDLAH